MNGAARYQWQVTIRGLRASSTYCYRVFLGSTDLLASKPSPRFRPQVQAGANEPFSFAVFGDWGKVEADGRNAHQTRVLGQIATSGVRFAITTGDVPYADNQPRTSTETEYGDLSYKKSAVFASLFWALPGRSIPLFVAPGNHGRNASFFRTWPQPSAVEASRGRYEMDTYCCRDDTLPARYPSAWYAFSAGKARFYILDASWSNSNVGTADLYENDYDYHWTRSSREYRWLAHDLATHSDPLKLAFFHFPPWSDNPSERSDTWLRGADSLEGLLARNGVKLAFNGHAHVYERNHPSTHGLVTYLTGGGGAKLEPIGGRGCSSFDAYGMGWSNSRKRGTKCGGGRSPSSVERLYHFLLVTIQNGSVTVSPIDERGRTFDVRTYDLADIAPQSPPPAPRALKAIASSPHEVRLRWKPARGTKRYRVLRNGKIHATSTEPLFIDETSPGRRYTYEVVAVGVSSLVSRPSNRQRIVLGTSGPDFLQGSGLADVVYGFTGRDAIRGRQANDRLYGGPGADRLSGGRGHDLLRGGSGRDVLFSRDGMRDTVRGGAGSDRARSDRRDIVRNVEARA